MKITSSRLAIALILPFAGTASAADYYMDADGSTAGFGNLDNQVWNTGNLNWTTDPAGGAATIVWADSNTAIFDLTSTASGGDTTLASGFTLTGLTLANASGKTFQLGVSGAADRNLALGGGNVDIGTGGTLTLAAGGGNAVNITGNFNKTGAGILNLTGSGDAYSGTATVSAGILQASNISRFGTSSKLDVGASGTFRMAVANSTYTIGELSGSGIVEANGSGTAYGLILDQATDSSFAGTIRNQGADDVLSFTKSGAGTFTVASGGTLNTKGTTTVTAGTLIIDTNSASVGVTAGNDVTVSGGTLAGIGNITTNANDVVVTGGKLAPGTDGTTGNLTLTLGVGTLDLSGLTGTGGLQFDLGTSSDLLTLTTGTLNVGAAILNFDDFDFTALSGFGTGPYTLIETSNTITGSLGASLTGTVGGFDATISLSDANTNLILTVVPEPGTWVMVLGGFGVVAMLRRFRRAGN